MMESLGNRLRQLRQNNRLRQDQVASLVGVNKNTMCSYEKMMSDNLLMKFWSD